METSPIPHPRGLSRVSALLEKEWIVLLLLSGWGLFVFYSGLSVPLRGDEGLYANIVRRIIRTGEWLPLMNEGQPYLSKPPLHFWQMALSLFLWGPNEFAFRFPSATFGLGMVFLAYWCGRVLFHRRLGLMAALITTTTFSTVWHAHEARFDVQFGFWMNLAFFACYLAYRGGGRRLGYLCLALLTATIGTALKGPVAVLLPGLTILAFLVITYRSRVVRELPLLLAGLAIVLVLTVLYYRPLGDSFNRHFFLSENLLRIVKGNKPVLFYFYTILAHFFPWSLFLPGAALYLWGARSRNLREEDLLLWVWFVGFFVLLNPPAFKAERFLVYVIPSFSLLMARYWDHVFSLESDRLSSAEDRLLRCAAALLALITVVAMVVGPWLIRSRFPIPRDAWSIPFALLMGVGCAAVLYTALGRQPKAVFSSVLAVAMVMTVGLVQLFYPALARSESALQISRQVRAIVGNSPLVVYHPELEFNADVLYYLDRPDPPPWFRTADELYAVLRSDTKVFSLMLNYRYEELRRRDDFPLVRIAEYSYRKRGIILVGNGGCCR